jgi:ABC-type uncharacterized transport system substrate-binding protein
LNNVFRALAKRRYALATPSPNRIAGQNRAWAPNQEEQYREAARYVDQILKGVKPGDLPVHYPGRYYLTINKSAAQGLGLVLPSSLIAKADQVLPK